MTQNCAVLPLGVPRRVSAHDLQDCVVLLRRIELCCAIDYKRRCLQITLMYNRLIGVARRTCRTIALQAHSVASLKTINPEKTRTSRVSWDMVTPRHSREDTVQTALLAAAQMPRCVPMKTCRIRVTGRVQGVFFRDWAVGEAQSLGVTGWIRNRRDGSIELFATGERDEIDMFLRRLHSGSPASHVQRVVVENEELAPFADFVRRPTV